jgi:hypothetical protein
MVTATVAIATENYVRVHDGSRTLYEYRARGGELEDPRDKHGINRDQADDIVASAGYLAGTWRWTDSGGGYYKAVVAPESAARKVRPYEEGRTPEQIRAANIKAFGNPEGRRR